MGFIMKNLAPKSFFAGLLATSMLAPAAVAQVADEPVQSVYEKYRPDFSATGVRSGGFLFYPTMAVEGKFDSNIYAQDEAVADEVDDFITIIKPALAVSSNWSSHFLSFTAGADIGRYSDNGTEDYEDISLAASGRYDITRGSNIFADLSYVDGHEDRGAPDSTGTQAETTKFSTLTAKAGYVRDEGIVSFAIDGSYTKQDFDDTPIVGGGTLDNDDRDRETVKGSIRLGYDLNDDYEAFVKFTAVSVKYDMDPTEVVAADISNKDSDGWDVVGGAAFKLGGKTEGEVYLGYIKRDFDAGDNNDVDDFKFGASLLWNATDLTSVRVAVDRDVIETALAAGILSTSYSLDIEHELRRNFLLKAAANFGKLDFLDVAVSPQRSDDTTKLTFGGKYMFNRNFSLNANYIYDERSTNAANQDYKRHAFMVSVGAQW